MITFNFKIFCTALQKQFCSSKRNVHVPIHDNMYSNVTELGILKGPEVGNFDLQYPKMENNYEEQS